MPSWIKIEVKDSDDDRPRQPRAQEEPAGNSGLLVGISAGLLVVLVAVSAFFVLRGGFFGRSGNVVATVNGEQISQQELAREKALFVTMSSLTQGQAVQAPSDFDILNQMIADRLKHQQARAAGVSISDTAVEGQIQQLEAQAGFTDARVNNALAQAGLDRSTLREWIRRQMSISQYVNQYLLPNVPAGQEDAAVSTWSNELQTQADVQIQLGGGAQQTAKVGQPAPDFALSTPDGETVRLADFRGQPVLVNFWATWCPPCKIEMPDLEQLYQKYRDQGFEIIAVDQKETPAAVKKYFDDMGLSFQPVIDSTGEIFNLYRVVALPTSYFIDANGVVQFQHRGLMTAEQMENYASQLMSN